MSEAAASISGLMASWLTPSCLFIFVNLVIGTIAITSRFTEPKRETDQPQLVRSPSLLERVRSFKLPLPHYEPVALPAETLHQPQLLRTPSLLERLNSFDFGLYKHQQTQYVQPDSEDPCPNPQEPQLTRTPSLLQRLRSRLYRSESIPGEEQPDPEIEGPDSKMRKSASERTGAKKWECDQKEVERRRPETATARSETTSLGEEEGVDAKADDFINRFKKQLRLQRMDSILRYREMLTANSH